MSGSARASVEGDPRLSRRGVRGRPRQYPFALEVRTIPDVPPQCEACARTALVRVLFEEWPDQKEPLVVCLCTLHSRGILYSENLKRILLLVDEKSERSAE